MERVYKIDLILIGVSVAVMIFLVGYAQPLVIAPLNDYESSDGDILFVIEKADILIVDDNIDFSSPDEYRVEDGLKIDLEPGKYYWKAVGVLGSEIRTLTIKSEVNLRLVEIEEGYGVMNAGNVRLNVDVYDGEDLVERVSLGVGDVGGEGDKFVGGME